jgi:ubiquinone/menaquinone biosynthesis C-methylase UbiE
MHSSSGQDTSLTTWTGALAQSAARVVRAAAALGDSRWASIQRAWCVPYMFHSMERVFAGREDPAPGLAAAFDHMSAYLETAAPLGMGRLSTRADERDREMAVEQMTGNHYGRLFREFDKESFLNEPVKLLRDRLTRNDVALLDLAKAKVLDAGCGGGRYSVAWRKLGAGHVLGVDLSQPGIQDARARVDTLKIDNVQFETADVVDLPLPSDSFDIVFSNGVLHHTRDWVKGLHNLVRVMKPGGLGWLYLIENPGGFFWDTIDLCREIMKDEVHEEARIAVSALGVPSNRVFYMLDHTMVPINVRLTPDEITDVLTAAGAKSIRRLARGTDFDRAERIFQNDPYAREKYGVGENRFVFSK